ncbi:MAG: hypothetical protein O3A08_12960, partial [Proteobacteria bacterium]|nr:hypothetical protein [Pseudomonadota bacterium]
MEIEKLTKYVSTATLLGVVYAFCYDQFIFYSMGLKLSDYYELNDFVRSAAFFVAPTLIISIAGMALGTDRIFAENENVVPKRATNRIDTIIVTPKHPMGQRVFVSFDVSPVGYLAH